MIRNLTAPAALRGFALGALLALGALPAWADSVGHGSAASQHSAAASVNGSAAAGSAALSAVALPLRAVGAVGQAAGAAGDAMWEAAKTPLPLADETILTPVAEPAPTLR
ncbi:MAG TPA: hypothetical protein VEH84_01205 [Alphaproteobacteria bacterium]|nr:hypothetical protein [Alphaproteobacteria bacterium]